jgi:hypothetical protein
MKTIPTSTRARYLARFGIFLVIVAFIAGTAGCDGDASQDVEIRTWYDLDAVKDNLRGHHILMNDLDSTAAGYEELASPTADGGKGWQPIGSEYSLFAGSFDGQGYEIRDLFINRPDEYCVGLFSTVDEEGVIENIGVVNANVTGYYGVGGLAGFNDGTVSDAYCIGSMTGYEEVGGLVGSSAGTVSNSYSIGSVTGDEAVGGLMGGNGPGTVSNSYSIGNVTGNSCVGGLTGMNSGTVSNSFFNYDEVLINGENTITIGALFGEDFDRWLANGKYLDVNERLSQENGYYVVNNITDFKELLAFGQNTTLKFGLANDLDLGTEPDFYIPYFAGEFDGNGHKVLNLSFNFDFVSHVGLFGYLASGGKIAQVIAENVNIVGARFVGGLVGYNHGGTVSDCYSSGHVTGNVSGTGNERCFGGLVGCNAEGTVSNCHATGSVTGYQEVGGLVGVNLIGTVSNSYSTDRVTGYASVGGLVGQNYGTVRNSYSIGDVTGEYSVGGLVGTNEESVSNSYSTGNVSGNKEVGGLVGANFGLASNSYSTGSVSGNTDVGGLVGRNWGTVHGSFWDMETMGQSTSDGGAGKTTGEMHDIATFSGAGWNIATVADSDTRNTGYIWNIVDGETYPFLSWQSTT